MAETWVMYAVFGLTVSYSNMLCRQLQRDRINVPDQQKTDATLFIKKRWGPTCSLYQHIAVKLFASGTATCLFSPNEDVPAVKPFSHLSGEAMIENLGSKEKRQVTLRCCRCERKLGPRIERKHLICRIWQVSLEKHS